MSVYAYVCPDCAHLASRHGLVGSDAAGPYRCPCGCERMQADTWLELTKEQTQRRLKVPGGSCRAVDRDPDGRGA